MTRSTSLSKGKAWRVVTTTAQDPEIRQLEEAARRVAKAEPLRAELADFVQAARTGTPPKVTGTDGLFAVAIAEMLLESSRTLCALNLKDEVTRRGWPQVLRTGLD